MKTYTVTFTSGLVHSHGSTQYRYAPHSTHTDVPELVVDVLRSIKGRTDTIIENVATPAPKPPTMKPSAPSPADRDDA